LIRLRKIVFLFVVAGKKSYRRRNSTARSLLRHHVRLQDVESMSCHLVGRCCRTPGSTIRSWLVLSRPAIPATFSFRSLLFSLLAGSWDYGNYRPQTFSVYRQWLTTSRIFSDFGTNWSKIYGILSKIYIAGDVHCDPKIIMLLTTYSTVKLS